MNWSIKTRLAQILGLLLILYCSDLQAGMVSSSYSDLPAGSSVDLSKQGVIDWVKFGNNEPFGSATWVTNRKASVTPLISTAIGTIGAGVVLRSYDDSPLGTFDWNDGQPNPAGSSHSVVAAADSFSLGDGVLIQVAASSTTRSLDIYTQGFNALLRVDATMSGGGSSVQFIEPLYARGSDRLSFGKLQVTFSGADEVLTVAITTEALRGNGFFPNAGVFAAVLVPEPTGIALVISVAIAPVLMRRFLR